jgi:hypothetical protein
MALCVCVCVCVCVCQCVYVCMCVHRIRISLLVTKFRYDFAAVIECAVTASTESCEDSALFKLHFVNHSLSFSSRSIAVSLTLSFTLT